MKVFWSKTALVQLKTISFYNSFSSVKNLSDKIVEHTALLQKFPEMGSLQNFNQDIKIYKKHEYRYLVEGNYKILYSQKKTFVFRLYSTQAKSPKN